MAKIKKISNMGDLAELRQWTKLVLDNAEIQSRVESGLMPQEDQVLFITGRAAIEANVYIATQIIIALQSKIDIWEKMIEGAPLENTPRTMATREDAQD